MFHLWVPVLVWGGMLEYPSYVLALFTGQYAAIPAVFCARILITRGLWVWAGSSYNTDDPAFIGKHDVRHIPEEPDFKAGQFIHMVHPHGLFCEAGYVVGSHTKYDRSRTVFFADKFLYNISPTGVSVLETILGIRVTYLDNNNIRNHLQQGFNCVVFPGGFKEIVGFDETEELINTSTYGYWFRMAREYNTNIFTSVIYDGSIRYFSQSGAFKKQRLAAATMKIPFSLPTGTRFPSKSEPIYTRNIQWKNTDTLRFEPKAVRKTILDCVEEDKKYHKGRIHIVSSM